MKLSIGIERPPKPISILKDISEDIEEEVQNDEDEEEEKDTNVTELPEKVDEFMKYVDKMYFGGELGEGAKTMFKSGIAKPDDDMGGDEEQGEDIADEEYLVPKPRRKILITT